MLENFKYRAKLLPHWQFSMRVLYANFAGLSSVFRKHRLGHNDDKILFIVGSGRSGNTLLRRLLIENLSIYIPPESYVLGPIVTSNIYAKRSPWPDVVDLTLSKFYFSPEFSTFEFENLSDIAAECKAWPKPQQSVGNIIAHFYKSLAAQKEIPADWIGDKTPLNTFNLGLIAKMFPQASYIYLERDGVDVVNSYLKSGLYTDIEQASRRWVDARHAWKNFKTKLMKQKYMEIKYESFVKDSQGTINSIETKFGISKRASKISISHLLGDVSTYSHHEDVSKPVTASSIGKGRNVLPDADLSQIAKFLNDDLVDAGYDSI